MAEPTTTPVRSGVGHRLVGRGHREQHPTVHAPGVLARGGRLGVEAANLTGDPDRVGRRVEGGDGLDAAATGQHRLPGGRGVQPDRVDGADAGDEGALFHVKQRVT
jgi:hypothetical protein